MHCFGVQLQHCARSDGLLASQGFDWIHRLKQLTVDVKAGLAVRHYKVVKSDRPKDLVLQSVKTGAPMRDNNILSRHIKPAARKLGLPWIN